MSHRMLGRLGAALVGLGLILLVAGTVLGGLGPAGWSSPPGAGANRGPFGAMGPGMMGGVWAGSTGSAPGPGAPGFVAGTPAAPRVVHVLAGPGYTFGPADVRIIAGETITFEVTTVGPMVHEFKVGPAAEVAADADAAPEIADIGMMETKSLTYTFSGSGPFAFACHEPGHYEAGMRGTITIVS